MVGEAGGVLSACTAWSLTQEGRQRPGSLTFPGHLLCMVQRPCMSGRKEQAAHCRPGVGVGVSGENMGTADLSGHTVLPGLTRKTPANHEGMVSLCMCPRWWQEGGTQL